MNIDPIWEKETDEDLQEYVRAVSTGPATPLVLAITTFRNQLNIGLTYRSTAFSPSEIDEFQRRFSTPLCSFNRSHDPPAPYPMGFRPLSSSCRMRN
jgi:hypothetical protein